MKTKKDRNGSIIGDGDYHVPYNVVEFPEYPEIKISVEESTYTESVYVRYYNRTNEKKIVCRFSWHTSNAVEFGEQLDGDIATKDEILFHLGLKSRKFVPFTYLSIWNRMVAKKEAHLYEEAPLTIEEMYALGEGADLSEYTGKLAKGGSRHLILGDKVRRLKKEGINRLGTPIVYGKWIYEV